MKKYSLILLYLTVSISIFCKTSITLTFRGRDSVTLRSLNIDSVSVKNLSQNCDTTIRGSVFELKTNDGSSDGINNLNTSNPSEFILKQIFPNPFSGTTNVTIYKVYSGPLNLILYDCLGRKLTEYHANVEKGFNTFMISSSGNGVVFLVVFDNKNSKSLKLIGFGHGQQSNSIRCIESNTIQYTQYTDYKKETLKNPNIPGFKFNLGNQMIYTAYADGYLNESITDNLIADTSYTYNMQQDSNMSRLIPRRLIASPPATKEDMASVTGWYAGNEGTVVLNTTEFHDSTASLKLTSSATINPYFDKLVEWNLDANPRLNLWVYLHTEASSFSNIVVRLYSGATSFFSTTLDNDYLKQNEWGLCEQLFGSLTLANTWGATGTPSWSNITKIRIIVYKPAGKIVQLSINSLSIGEIVKPSIVIQFDDAPQSVYNIVYPVLQSRKMAATTYVIGSFMNGVNSMTDAQFLELNKNNWDIANHTEHHANLSMLTQKQIIDEVEACREKLDALGLTRASKYVAYPGGLYNETVLAAMSAWGAKLGRTTGIINTSSYFRGWPYELNSVTLHNDNTLEEGKKYVRTTLMGQTLFLHFHTIADTNAEASPYTWLTADFIELMDYILSLGIQTLTIDEYNRLNSGDITVLHR